MPGAAAHAEPLLGVGASLYALDRTTLDRIDATSGRVVAHATVANLGFAPVTAGGLLWLAPDAASGASGAENHPRITLIGYNESMLAPVARVALLDVGAGPEELPAPPLATSGANSDLLYTAVGDTIVAIDAAARQVVDHYSEHGGDVVDLAVDADGSEFFVAVDDAEAMTGRVDVLDPVTGAVRTSVEVGNGIENNGGLTSSAGGLWVHSSGGMGDHVGFYRGVNLTPTGSSAATDVVGSRPSSVTVSGNTVWLGGPGELGCADPRTGRLRASVQIPNVAGGTAIVDDLHFLYGWLFGYYYSGAEPLLVRLDPPKACTA